MAKIELRGIVKEVTKIEKIGRTGETKKQSLIVLVPAYVDDFGDKKGEDEEWSLDVFNSRIDHFNLNSNLLDKKVVCSVYVNSRKVSSEDGKIFYAVNTNLASLKLFESNQPVSKPTNAW